MRAYLTAGGMALGLVAVWPLSYHSLLETEAMAGASRLPRDCRLAIPSAGVLVCTNRPHGSVCSYFMD